MSMWTLMQRRMDGGKAPNVQSRPTAQTPTMTHDHSPPRRSDMPVRRSRTLDRWPTMPIRCAKGLDVSGDSTLSRSPIRRSSSSESCIRDTLPVNFWAALNTEDKVKQKTISDEEDDEGSQKKISAAQYQLFRQTVTSSKGTYKINPSKFRRAPRVALIDLGETESSDRVSWLDQPSLVDTMVSTARIAQGLKDDEDVEKTTLSDILDTSSSTVKHLPVKQIFPREPYRLKVHRDAQYLPKPPAENGFSENKAPASYQISYHGAWHRRVSSQIGHLRFACQLHGGVCHWRTVTERPEIKVVVGETDHHPWGPGICLLSRVCFQLAASAERCFTQELWLPASSLELCEDGAIRMNAFSGSRTQGTPEQGQGHPSSSQDDWLFSDVCSGDQTLQDQHEDDFFFQEESVQDIHFWSSWFSCRCFWTENRDTGTVLSRWRRQGSPPQTLPRSPHQN